MIDIVKRLLEDNVNKLPQFNCFHKFITHTKRNNFLMLQSINNHYRMSIKFISKFEVKILKYQVLASFVEKPQVVIHIKSPLLPTLYNT